MYIHYTKQLYDFLVISDRAQSNMVWNLQNKLSPPQPPANKNGQWRKDKSLPWSNFETYYLIWWTVLATIHKIPAYADKKAGETIHSPTPPPGCPNQWNDAPHKQSPPHLANHSTAPPVQ